MNAAEWSEKRNRGLMRYLLVDGILITGGPFAVVMQFIGYFLFGSQYESFGAYFSAQRTWLTFFLHGTLFGLIMGFVKWRRYERAFATGGKQA
jgi:hypothetical protein